jgi:hypothetical protein
LTEQHNPAQPSKHEHRLSSVMGQKLTGHAMTLIIGAAEADAEYEALNELGFVTVSETILPRNSSGQFVMQRSVPWERVGSPTVGLAV